MKDLEGFVLYITMGTQVLEFSLQSIDDNHITLGLQKYGIDAYIDISVWDGQWLFEENRYFGIYVRDLKQGKVKEVSEAVIKDNDYIMFKSRDGKIKFTVLSIAITPEFSRYVKYSVPEKASISIGSAADNTIVIPSNMVNAHHCIINVANGKAQIKDCGSKYGTIVNGQRIGKEACILNPLDTLLLSGYKINYMGSVIAVNRPNSIRCSLNVLTSLDASDVEDVSEESDMFVCSPRLLQPFDKDVITLEAPPTKKQSDEMPAIFTYGPAVTMPMPMLVSVLVNSQLMGGGGGIGARVGILISMGMSAVLGVIWSVARNKYRKKKDATDEKFRVEQYTKYIDQNVELLAEKESFNKDILNSQFLPTSELLLCLNGQRHLLWNRNINHPDFLTIRIGLGCCLNYNEVKGPEERFSLTNDELLELPHKVVEEHKFLSDVPTTLDLKAPESKIIGIIGEQSRVKEATKNIIVQTAALHNYLDVKLCILYNEDEGNDYDWVRWLPHTFVADNKLRLVGCTEQTRAHVLNYLIEDLNNRAATANVPNDETKTATQFPYHYVIVITTDKVFEGNQLATLMKAQAMLGATFVLAYGTMAGIPNECRMLMECSPEYTGCYRLDDARDATADFAVDTVPVGQFEWFARRMSGFRMKEVAHGDIPSAIDFLTMLGIGRLEHWDLAKKYRENHAYNSIKAMLGIGANNKAVYLDLHEKKHGPHGLVAGTTGSGKSETLQTAILSWLLNYSSNEVAFVLIDYKGGGMANMFEGVPHLAGTITNISDDEETKTNNSEQSVEIEEEEDTGSLDDSQTRRALAAIKAEIKYRQGIFRDYKVNHIDAYMKLYQRKKAEVPLPHLIIISDEFAELKKEQPAFIKELVSAARVGRSLGIHLILATQKPGNSVDDEIWANSRFKICLRVQDRADSMSMLKRPEAASITRTGRGLFQLGNDEIFEEFQSGWSGAEYVPMDKIKSPEDSVCTMIELDGTDTPIEVEHKAKSEDALTQLEACVAFIREKSLEMGLQPVRQLWPPQLTKKMYLPQLMQKHKVRYDNSISAFIGLVDDPEKQAQYPAVVNFYNTNNVVVTSVPGMGKSTLLQTMLYSLVQNYTPEQLNMYLIDFSSSALRLFKSMRHCGGYVTAEDEAERVHRLLRLLSDKMDERKELFANESVGNFAEYKRKHNIPLILVVIDNFLGFFEFFNDKDDQLFNELQYTAREGTKYGIQFVVTAAKMSDMRSKLRSSFLNALALYHTEKSDYREIYSTQATFLPPRYKGRGLYLMGKKLLEYHVALPVEGATEAARNETLVVKLTELNETYKGYAKAQRIPVIPKNETYAQFLEDAYTENTMYPVGYNTVDISRVYLDLTKTFVYSYSDNAPDNNGISLALNNMLEFCRKAGIHPLVIKLNRRVPLRLMNTDEVVSAPQAVYTALRTLEKEIFARVPKRKEELTKNKDVSYSKKMWSEGTGRIVIIDSLPDLMRLCRGDVFLKLDSEPENKQAGPMYENLSVIFENGFDLGVTYFAGVPNSEISGELVRQSMFRNYTLEGTAQHFGGSLKDVKTFRYTGSISQGNLVTANNVAVMNTPKGMVSVHVPDYVEGGEGNE